MLEDIAVDTEDGANVLVRFCGGACGVMHVLQVAAARKNRIFYEINAERQTLAWDAENPDKMWLGAQQQLNQQFGKNPLLSSPQAAHFSSYPGGHAEGFADSHKQCFAAFYDKIEGRESPLGYPTFAEGHRESRLCEAILESTRKESWVPVVAS